MDILNTIFSIVMFILSLSVLITIHEAGHLSMAKLFKVYCHEFSIGFGPALLHKKGKGKETYFSIRAIPLGGYVSMYGEADEKPDPDLNIPEERSVEGIAKWKKAIVVSAGVILNALLALILIGVSNICFPIYQPTATVEVETNSVAAQKGIKTNYDFEYLYPSSFLEDGSISPFEYQYTDSSKTIHAGSFYVVDNNVVMNDVNYVLVYQYPGNKGNQSFVKGLALLQAIDKSTLVQAIDNNAQVKNNDGVIESATGDEALAKAYYKWLDEEESPNYYADFTKSKYNLDENTKFDTTLKFNDENDIEHEFTISMETEKSNNKYVFKEIGLSFIIAKVPYSFKDRVKYTFIEYGQSSIAVFKGIGILFSTGLKNASGIVGIYETSSQIFSNYTFATYLSFWGLISVNLAIFNLLPFPGLDGWQLLVTTIEGVSKKKLPKKFKAIMSFIGLGLLFLLMIAILVLDVVKMVGI